MENILTIGLLVLNLGGLITLIIIALTLLRLVSALEQQQPAPIIWNQVNAEILLKRKGFIRSDGALSFWGDGDNVLPLNLKKYAGRQPWLILVDERAQQ